MKIQSALVVDDSKVAYLTLRKLLQAKGITVEVAKSGEEALEALQRKIPDIVFMDILMPGMGGHETTRAITSNPATAQVPVVMCSSNVSDEDRRLAGDNGAAGFMGKPYGSRDLDQALETVQAFLAEREAKKAAAPEAVAPTISEDAIRGIAAEVAERVSRELAEKAAKVVAEQTAHEAAAQTAREIAEQVARGVSQALYDGGLERTRAIATEAAQALVGDRLEQAASGSQASEEAFRATAEEVATRTVQARSETIVQEAQARASAVATEAAEAQARKIWRDFERTIEKQLEEQVLRHVHDLMRKFIAGQEFRNGVLKAEESQIESTAEAAAVRVSRDTAEQVAHEVAEASALRAAKAAAQGLKWIDVILGLGLLGVIGYLAYTALA